MKNPKIKWQIKKSHNVFIKAYLETDMWCDMPLYAICNLGEIDSYICLTESSLYHIFSHLSYDMFNKGFPLYHNDIEFIKRLCEEHFERLVKMENGWDIYGE